MKNAVVYSTATCPYCVAAKSLLAQQGYQITEYDVGRDAKRYAEMQSLTPQRTVPQITIDGDYIGGYTALVEYFSSNGS